MAQLDAMLRALADRGALELVLSEGARPSFRFEEGDRPVSQSVLSRAQIVTLLAELGGDRARLSNGGPSRFAYQLGDGRRFVVDAGRAAGAYAARLPLETAKPAEPPPPAPSAAEPRFDPAKVRAGAPAIEAYFVHLVETGASDLHVSAGETPMLRLHGEMVRIEGAPVLSPEEAARLLFPLMPLRFKQEFEQASDTDFAHEIPGLARFRCNVFMDRKGVGGVFRVIPSRIPSAEDLGLSKAIPDLCNLTKGLVLVTGLTGSGLNYPTVCRL